jgi:protocatechuate 3,4-dioxygenase beta subunit
VRVHRYGPIAAVVAVLTLALVPGATSAQGTASDDAVDTALAYVGENAAELGVTSGDVRDLAVTSAYRSRHNGVTHVNLNQRFRDLEVFGAHATVNVADDGRVLFVGGSFQAGLSPAPTGDAEVGAAEAVEAAADELELGEPTGLRVLSTSGGPAQKTVLSGGGISDQRIPARLGWQPSEDSLRLAWQLTIDDSSAEHLWNATVDAASGDLLAVDDWTSQDSLGDLGTLMRSGNTAAAAGPTSPDPFVDGSSYRVFDIPKESPNDGPRGLVTNPADAPASPFGWHDTDGAPGAEFTITRGANVHAYLDQDNNNAADFGDTDGGPGLTFDFPADLNEHAQNYRDAVVTNLFYLNSVFHDVMWRYGFDEESGNFQANNYGRGGTAGDYVRAEAADGSGTNNANFATPIETPTSGGTPRMQMFLWPGNQFGAQNQVVADGVGAFDANWSRFGPSPTVAGVAGTFVYAGTGCDAGLYPSPLPTTPWIAVVDGGTTACTFLLRVQIAESLGASGVVVAHTSASPPVLTASMTTPPVGIPAVAISQANGNAIKAAIAAGTTTGTVRKHPDHPGIRDGDFDNGIIIHEYGHGVSNRLTGGPAVNCLSGNEQAGEGWSDYLAITLLLDPALDDPDEPRGMGPYALFEADRHGDGIRPRPYSRDMAIQPFTYDSIKSGGWLEGASLALPHGLGHGWAAVLWDLNWDLIDKHGFNPNLYEPWNTGGNNRALQYVVDGLKMQGCGPGLVVARGAIAAAAEALGGEDTCTVWATFARRGLGFSAVQGTTDRNDNSEAFDTHPECREAFFGLSDQPALNTVNRGESVEMEFDAGGDRGLDILASGSPFSRQVNCQTLRTEEPGAEFITPRPLPIPAETPGNSGLSYDPETGRYTFPWQTDSAWGGTCREFVLTRDDGVQHRAYFRIQANPAHVLSGRVRDSDGAPVANATVTVRGPIFAQTTSDAEGLYSFEPLPRGTYEATASAGGCFDPQTQTVVLSRPRTVDFTLPKRTDAFGYTCAPEAAAFEEAGMVVPITGTSGVGTIDLPFTFTFYGFPHTKAHVCANGFVEFVGPATTSCSSSNAAIPTTGRPNGQVAAFWDDWVVDDEASIRSEAKGTAPNRRFVIEFRNVHIGSSDTSRRVDFNVVLFENGEILTQYRNIADDARERGSSATLGIENHTGTDALRYSFNEASLASEPAVTSIRYRPPPLGPAHTVSGFVRDAENQPIANATVAIEDTPITPATTDAEGRYSFELIPEGSYTVTASASGCIGTQTQELVVSGPTTLDFTLPARSDAFGHTCELVEVPFEEAETVLPITGTSGVGTIDLPFPFTFYGFTYTRAHVCANGFVEFVGPATTNCSSVNAGIPTTGRPNGQIAAFWDDWVVDAEASIRADVRGSAPDRRFVIEYRNVHIGSSDTSRRVDFNVVLHESGEILTQYRNIANDARERGSSATMGIENHLGTDALRFSFNQSLLSPEPAVTSVRYTPPPPPPSHPVSGHVRDADGDPIAHATVTIEGTPLSATTDVAGSYSFPSVPEGTYDATATGTGCHSPQTLELVVSAPTTLDFTLPPNDEFGYTCELEEAAFEQADTVVPLTGDDEVTTIDLPFPFTFYGETYTRAHLCTNGFLEFVGPTTTNCSASNAGIPTTGRPNGAVYGFWDDLQVDDLASIRADVRGTAPERRFVVEFRNVHFFNDTTRRIDFNVVLHENGEILTQYRNLADDGRERGNSATLGIEHPTGTTALRFSFNQTLLATEPAVTSIRYTPAAIQAVSGQVRDADDQPVANATVTIEDTPLETTTDAEGLYSFPRVPEGNYTVTVTAYGCIGDLSQELVVSGPTTLDFALPRRSDAYGHTCELVDVPFEQADTVLPITGTAGVEAVELPFPFTFYGFTYTQARVCANGFVEFVGPATTNCSSFNAAIPTTGRPNGQIAAFWDDWVVDAEASIRADVRGSAPDRRFVIEFHNVHIGSSDTSRRVDFNVVLFENGDVLTQYRNIADDARERGSSATMGIENHLGTDALRFSFNDTLLAPEPAVTSIRYTGPPPPPSHPVSGHVRDADGDPIADATVTIEGTPITPATTGADGSYSFPSVPEGTYQATVSAIRCDGERTQELVVSGPTTLDFTLPPRSDEFGYTCELEEATFEQADTVVPLTGDDNATTIDLPFPFTFYGETYTRAHLCTNGFVEFVGPTTTNCSASNAGIPTSGRPNGAVHGYWDDLFVDAQASIRADVRGTAPDRRFVIEFRNVHYFNDDTRRIDFNIVLHENGELVTQYSNVADDERERGGSATIGLENETGTDALRFSFNEAVLGIEPAVTSVRYVPPE